jgi:hypothetical protein
MDIDVDKFIRGSIMLFTKQDILKFLKNDTNIISQIFTIIINNVNLEILHLWTFKTPIFIVL